jgi:hypothetical protein
MCKQPVLGCCGIFVLLLVVVGCGKKTPTHEANRGGVTGSITLDGKPIGGGEITFISAKDPIYRVTAMVRFDGSFRVADAPTGEVLVAVDTASAQIGNPKGYVAIPAKYKNIKTSGLTANILKDKPEGITLNFDLKSK